MKTTFFGEILGKTGNHSLPWGRSPGNLFLDKFWLNLDKFWLNLDKFWLNLDKLGLKWIKLNPCYILINLEGFEIVEFIQNYWIL